jgi:molybdopterin-guanine dinucleotide biosynthesis protein A
LKAAGIILAGGQSRRMGREKALLSLPGITHETFIEHLLSILHAVCSEVILVVRDHAQAALYIHLDAGIVCDEQPGVGPLMGLYSGLRAINASHALVTAVDLPLLQPAMAAFLLSQPLSDALLVPVVEDIPQVLLAVYPRSVLPLIEERLREGRRDPRSLLAVAQVRLLEEAQLRSVDPLLRSFVNINTPADLALLDHLGGEI